MILSEVSGETDGECDSIYCWLLIDSSAGAAGDGWDDPGDGHVCDHDNEVPGVQ